MTPKMEMHYRETGQSGKHLIILHGVFGASDNWMTLARKLGEAYQVWALDLRNHGHSAHTEGHNYDLMAADLEAFIHQHQLSNPTIMGHSMGGKVAMKFALSRPSLLAKLVVVDIAPRHYPVHHGQILKAFEEVGLSGKSKRGEVEEELKDYISDFGVRQFIMKNLYRREDNSFAWRINVPAISANIDQIGQEINASQPFEKPTLFVGGEKSDYIKPSDSADIKRLFTNSQLTYVKDAGHWIHAEQPQAFLDVLLPFLAS